MYRDDYARAGSCMLPVHDQSGDRTARRMVGYCVALFLVSLIPSAVGWAGAVYLVGADFLGIRFLMSAIRFLRTCSADQARRVLLASLVYLPVLLAVLLVDGVFRSWAGAP
jgi:protoheme IX farnesyltransferase